jgi:hypothetical protein
MHLSPVQVRGAFLVRADYAGCTFEGKMSSPTIFPTDCPLRVEFLLHT